jgi:hypothetical protein
MPGAESFITSIALIARSYNFLYEPGRARGYVEGWFDVPFPSSPIFRFYVGYIDKDSPMPLNFSVRINGSEVWREEVKPDPAIKRREVSLNFCKGGKSPHYIFSGASQNKDGFSILRSYGPFWTC